MDFSFSAQSWVNVVLIWIGFGIVVGMTARMVLPDGVPRHAFGTLVIGVMGSCTGPFLISYFIKPEQFNPIGPAGFFASVLSSIVLLILYRFGEKFSHR